MILRTRIMALAGSLALLFLAVMTYTLFVFASTSAQIKHIVEQNLFVEQTAETLNSTILEVHSDIWDTMLFDFQHRAAQIARLDSQAALFYQDLRDLAQRDPPFTATAENLHILFQAYYQFGSTILNLKSLDEFLKQAQLVQKFRQNQVALLTSLSKTLATSKSQFSEAMKGLDSRFSFTSTLTFFLSAFVTVLSFLLAFLIARRLTSPLERLTKAVHIVTEGDFTVRPIPISSGEIRELTETFITMLDQIEDYRQHMEDLVRARTDALVRANVTIVKELKLAQKVQDALIPRHFPAEGPLSAAAAYLPMEELGGDFYDVMERSPGEWIVVIADVSGHGVAAALVTAMMKVSLGLHTSQAQTPGAVLDEVNRELCGAIGELRRYVTMILCHLDLASSTLTYSNAGHNEMLLLRASGQREILGPNSGVVGLKTDELFLTRSLPFHPGDSLFLFTDGLIEARNEAKKEFGLERLLALVQANVLDSPKDLIDRVRHEIETFSQGQPQQDDIAFLAIRWETSAVQEPVLDLPYQVLHNTILPRAEELYNLKDYDALLEWSQPQQSAGLTARQTSRLLHLRAMALHHKGEDRVALETWAQAVQTDPQNHRARRNRELLDRHLKEAEV